MALFNPKSGTEKLPENSVEPGGTGDIGPDKVRDQAWRHNEKDAIPTREDEIPLDALTPEQQSTVLKEKLKTLGDQGALVKEASPVIGEPTTESIVNNLEKIPDHAARVASLATEEIPDDDWEAAQNELIQ